MIYYFLPDHGIFGGVKVACQFVELLGSLGVRAVVVTPRGRAPQWFPVRAAVVSEQEAFERIGASDHVVITWPPDHERLRRLPAPMICHAQGTDPRMDPIFADPRVRILTCWTQATDYAIGHGAVGPIEVGISIADQFYFAGERKADNRVAFMPRRGFPLVRACVRRCRDVDFVPIEGLSEAEVAGRLKASGIYLATAEGEEFGLPALEAMAAGCAVVSVPVKGGMEYLHDGDNCLMAESATIAERLAWLVQPEQGQLRDRIRQRAVATATRYRAGALRARLETLLAGPLQDLRT